LPAKRLVRRTLGLLLGAAVLWLAALSGSIVRFGVRDHATSHDAAIVLGAAVYGSRPSPVFRERIRHALGLYRAGTVRKLIFTGGFGPGAARAESEVARDLALRAGVPASDILIETRSRTTRQNLLEARLLMASAGLRTAAVVSDPLHMKRALRMSSDLGMAAVSSPTPTTRYRGWRSKAAFLIRELYFYHHYLITGN
jgi:uncharacterized SAM-binding protein YcdF (DUF218 family)